MPAKNDRKYEHLTHEWIEKYKSGKDLEKIADEYEVHMNTVSKYICEELKVDTVREIDRESPYPIEEWIHLYREGKTIAEVADGYQESKQLIGNKLREKGEGSVKNLRLQPEKWIRAHTEEGMSLRQITLQTPGVGRETIKKVLTDAGVFTNKKHEQQVSEEEIEKWTQLHTQGGMTPNQIAKRSEFAYRTVRSHLIEKDIFKPSPEGGEADYSIEGIIDYYTEVDEQSGCWTWTGKQHGSNKYPRFEYEGEILRAHRQSIKIHRGVDPDNHEVIRHKCDRKMCVNPNHLEPGNHEDNVKDHHGIVHDLHTLTHNQIQALIEQKDEDWLSLAEEFGIRLGTVRRILEQKPQSES